jgi:lipopolysaccharide biosynthesis regulator YciM
MSLISEHVPEEKDIFSAQYDILIAKGDETSALSEKTDLYINAMKLNPSAEEARSRIEKLAMTLSANGKSEDANAVLTRAMAITPDYKGFASLMKTLQQVQDIRAETVTLLLKIKNTPDFSEKTKRYDDIRAKLDDASARYGAKKLTDLKRAVADQIRSDISGLKNSQTLIPENFMALVNKGFPEIAEEARHAQYAILLENGDQSADKTVKADYYIQALALDKTRNDARSRIETLAQNLDANNDNPSAMALLTRAIEIDPNDLIFLELSGKLKRELDVFATVTGCDRANQITQAPISIDSLNICISYRNLATESVVNVVMLNADSGHRMEIPVVLDDRSGSKSVDILAPIEGFSVGEYVISVMQNEKMLAQTPIQFLPKRR